MSYRKGGTQGGRFFFSKLEKGVIATRRILFKDEMQFSAHIVYKRNPNKGVKRMQKREIVVYCIYLEEEISFWSLMEESFRLFLRSTIAEDEAKVVSCL